MPLPTEQLPANLLPELAAELLPVIGWPALRELIAKRGGTRIGVPVAFATDHWLVRVIGADATQALIRYAGGTKLDLPRCKKALSAIERQQILARRKQGALPRELAVEFGYTERWIWYLLAESEPSPQLGLL